MFEVIALRDCPYSAKAVDFLNMLSRQNPKLKVHVTWVDQASKQKYKTAQHSTFPQISYVSRTSKGDKKIWIGGSEELEQLYNLQKGLKQQYSSEILAPFLQLFLTH